MDERARYGAAPSDGYEPRTTTEQVLVPTHVLDFLRGVAAVYVVINHTRGHFFKGGARVLAEATEPLGIYDYGSLALLQLTSLGAEFVIMFFCISGFAMAHSMAHTRSIGGFYVRRIIRIWPPYVIAVALAGVVCWLELSTGIDRAPHASCAETFCNPEGLLRILTYVDVHTPITPQFWSLPYEVIFYALCPLLLLPRARIPLIFMLSVAVTSAGVLSFGLEMNPSSSIMVNFFINALIWFMSGALAYQMISRWPVLSPRLFIFSSTFLILAMLSIKTAYGESNIISNLLMIIFTINCIRNLPRSVTCWHPSNWGFFSYSIYIFHFAFIALLQFAIYRAFGIVVTDISKYWVWVVFLPPVFLGCWIMYFMGERQCNQLLRRLRCRTKT